MCKWEPCIVIEWEIEDYLPEEGAATGERAIQRKEVRELAEPPEDEDVIVTEAKGEFTRSDAVEEKLRRDFDKAQGKECEGESCLCIKQEGKDPVSNEVYIIPLLFFWTNHQNISYRFEGTVRVRVKEFAGRCVKSPLKN